MTTHSERRRPSALVSAPFQVPKGTAMPYSTRASGRFGVAAWTPLLCSTAGHELVPAVAVLAYPSGRIPDLDAATGLCAACARCTEPDCQETSVIRDAVTDRPWCRTHVAAPEHWDIAGPEVVQLASRRFRELVSTR